MAKPLPIPLFKSPESASKIVDGAETLEQACAIEFRDITGRENRLSTRGRDEFPVCCIGRENDYWTLQCNDHDLITDDQRQELASRLRKWEHSRAMR